MSVGQPAKTTRPVGALAVVGLAVLASSCGGGRKPVFPVRGQVLDAKGKPAAGALVIFHPVQPDPKGPPKPVGRADEDGRFALTTYKEGDGAPAGEYVITVTWPRPKKSPFEPEAGDRLQGRYASPDRSNIRFTVENKPDNEVTPIRVQ
jgi:hypothetical protein